MHVIIPASGYGTRLRPHTYTKPKPLVRLAGSTILGHILDRLEGAGVSEITFIVGYLGEQIREYVHKQYPHFKANYVEQPEMRGQAHAIYLARELVKEPVLELVSVERPPSRSAGRVIQGEASEAARELVRLLREEAKAI